MTAAVARIHPPQDALADILRLIDLEDQGEAEVQAHSMRAAKALFDLKEDTARWVPDMERLKAETERRTNAAVQWSPNSERTFHKWLVGKLEESGHRTMPRAEVQRLTNAEGMRRIVVKVAPRGATLPQTEGAWRPAAALYKSGYHKQLVDVVLLAGELAEREGLDGITTGVMSAARAYVWKTDREIQAHGKHPDQATERDKAIRARNEAERWVKELWKTGQVDQMNDFQTWVTEWLRNWEAVK